MSGQPDDPTPGTLSADELERLNLDVYNNGPGLWHPEHGDLETPDGWESLASGDAYVTRQVKAAGVYWTVWRPRGRHRDHRRKLGLVAPVSAIDAARASAAATEPARAKQRVVGSRSRDRAEARYRTELAAAVRTWLDFAPEHAALAGEIADGVAEHATVVGSGRVGRTRTLELEERVVLATRAYIRHRFTPYEGRLEAEDPVTGLIDEDEHRWLKVAAHAEVDEFLAEHRRRLNVL